MGLPMACASFSWGARHPPHCTRASRSLAMTHLGGRAQGGRKGEVRGSTPARWETLLCWEKLAVADKHAQDGGTPDVTTPTIHAHK